MKGQISKLLGFFFIIIAIHAQSESQQVDRQTQHIQQFARTMSDFVPSQTFTFHLGIGQQQNFILWPQPEIQKIRGVFYIDNSQDPEAASADGFFVGCEVNGAMKKTFVNERLGVFTLTLQTKPSNTKFIFKSDSKPLTIYLSYELKKDISPSSTSVNTDQNVGTKEEEQVKEKKSKLQQVSEKFQKVHSSVQGQQNALRMVLKMIGKHSKRLEGEVKYANYRISIETVVILISGVVGMLIIKKQMNSGYELLV